jgi:putative nucleotidyltransferase with HDIG domain
MRRIIYFSSVILFAGTAVVWAAVRHPVTDWGIVLFLGLLGFLIETLAFAMPILGSVSLSFAVVLAAALYSGPLGGAFVGVAGSLIPRELKERKPLLNIGFNAAQLALSGVAAGVIYLSAGGVLWGTAGFDGAVDNLLPTVASATGLFALNATLVAFAITLMTEMPLMGVLRQQNLASYLTSFLVLALMGLVLVELMRVATVLSVLLLVLPFALARETFQVYLELTEAYTDTVRSLVTALEAKDLYTRGHSERVARYSRAIAQALGMSKAQIERIEIAALMHDIGKVGIGKGILSKPGKLTAEEVREIRSHPATGMTILSDLRVLSDLSRIVVAHHERWDGSGYPNGLSGEAIPFESRILAVADAYDAMTSDRPYRSALSRVEAVDEVRRGSGIQFDSTVVAAFMASSELGGHTSLSSGSDE